MNAEEYKKLIDARLKALKSNPSTGPKTDKKEIVELDKYIENLKSGDKGAVE